MIELAGRVLASVIAIATLVGVFATLAPIPMWQACLVCVGWGLAYFGDELAPLINLESTPSTSRYIDPVVRTIGWLFLLAAFGLYGARVLRLWSNIMWPNPSLNADVPHAWADARRSGPPVSLFR